MGLFAKLFNKKTETASSKNMEDFISLTRVYFQSVMAVNLGITNIRFIPDVANFKHLFKIPTVGGRLGQGEKAASRKMLMQDENIRTGGNSGLYYFTVLSCYANFRTSYKRIDGISYTIYPGEWICRVSELTEWFRTRFQHQAISILKDLQDRHLITYSLLGRGKLIKFKIKGWCKHNRVLDYNAPCQKDTGFFFLPVSAANELVGSGRCSEIDAMLDLWVNTIYNDTQVQGSELGPVVYMRDGTGNPLIGYAELAERWGVSKATAGRYLHKMQQLGYISMVAFSGTHGTAIYLKQYLSTMFQISDVLIDKDEVAMSLNLNIHIDDTS